MKTILSVDSDYEDVVHLVAEHRRKNVYLSIDKNIYKHKDYKKVMATRKYVSEALLDPACVFFTGSGHGLEKEFKGDDTNAVLETNDYDPQEVSKKIIHLLSCHTGFILGKDVVTHGCIAFFGYDVPFTYFPEYIEEFLAPDAEIDLAIMQGLSAKDVHQVAMKAYDKQIKKLTKKNVEPAIITTMMVNQKYFCSPVLDSQWGDVNATL